MAVGYSGLPALYPVSGVRIGVAAAGIKKVDRDDLVLFELQPGSSVAATFTRNAFCAAPVVLARQHLQSTASRYLLVNTGNANAGTGKAGLADAVSCCDAVAQATGCRREEVLPFSTGVIGEPLPVERITDAIPALCASLDEDNWSAAASGILTTDTVPKGSSRQLTLEGKTVTITGISKGSGMIRPDMGTMLAYVATDAGIEQALLDTLLREAVAQSFNCITVDGDTSTNDACVAIASGASGVELKDNSDALKVFGEALTEMLKELAQLIVRDGEGATKFVSIEVASAADEEECRAVAYTVAHSPLVKTALFASDPNWGRILAAVGRAGIEDLDLDAVTIHLGDVCIVRDGGRDQTYTEEAGQAVMSEDEVTIRIDLQRGAQQLTVWTCDFSYDYVRINAEYRT